MKKVGTGKPHPLFDKIPTKSPCGFGFKKLGLGQTPAPLVGTKSQLLPKKIEGSPYLRVHYQPVLCHFHEAINNESAQSLLVIMATSKIPPSSQLKDLVETFVKTFIMRGKHYLRGVRTLQCVCDSFTTTPY